MNYQEIHNSAAPFVWIALAVIILFFAIISMILHYHWTRYGVHPKSLRWVRALYFGVSALLLAALFKIALLIT